MLYDRKEVSLEAGAETSCVLRTNIATRSTVPAGDALSVQKGFLDDAVVLSSCYLGVFDLSKLNPEERAQLPHRSVAVRQREFVAGRACAAEAMRRLGYQPRPVQVANDRSPVWPDGLIGSISHSRHLAGAVVARRDEGFRAIGLDLEEATPLHEELLEEICVDAERNWLAKQPAQDRALLAKMIFCAKEAAYKCQYPLTGEVFGFDTLHIDLSVTDNRFSVRFLTDVGEFNGGDQFGGRIWASTNHFVAVLALR